MREAQRALHVVTVGAGPAGLTAAYELARHGISCDVLEADRQVGGIMSDRRAGRLAI